MEVWNPEHPHHAVWREYTQSLLDGKPKVVEYRSPGDTIWKAITVVAIAFFEECQYRIARPMLTLKYSVPMPVTEALSKCEKYWLANPELLKAAWGNWTDDPIDFRRLRAGLIYRTEADAQAAIDARNAAMTAALEGAK